ncbi:N-acetyltransferase [Vibrio nigripulchritudo]|nr:N-acetyltransferase [Vibrio nigripulchritudo]BDU31281.1 N-acetyltransferase [Vibrio nigripulchritudo]
MEIKLNQVVESEFEAVLSVVKEGLFSHVDAVFGWDDQFQRELLSNDYEPHWFYWVYRGSQRVGMLCFKPYDNAYHVHLLIVIPEFQGQGVGKCIMDHVHHLAKHELRDNVTLSSFMRNEKAVKFYKQLGYEIKEADEHFYSLALELAS